MKTLLFIPIALAAFGFSFCHAATFQLSGGMDVLQAGTNDGFGSGSGNGSGTISGDYDESTKLLSYTIAWQDLMSPGTVTNMHFHAAAPGSPGGVDLSIPANSGSEWVSPVVGSAIALDAAQAANLLAGLWYVNVHTSNIGGGEIRGQVLVNRIPEPATAGLTVVCLATITLTRRRRSV